MVSPRNYLMTPGRLLVLLASLVAPIAVHAQEVAIHSISAAVERVSTSPGIRATLIVSLTDADGKPVEAFARAFDHIGPPPPQTIGSPKAAFNIYAWLCETWNFDGAPDKATCGWVPFKVDGTVEVLKSSDPSEPLQQPSIYRLSAVPAGTQIGTKDFSKLDSSVSFLVRARITRLLALGVGGEPLQLTVLSQREAVAVWRTPPSKKP